MGLSLVLPGMSAGTAALILGIYRRIVFDARRLRLLALAPLAAGVLAGGLATARLVEVLLEEMRDPLVAFLFGLVAASSLWLLWSALSGHRRFFLRGTRLHWARIALCGGVLAGGVSAAWLASPERLTPVSGNGFTALEAVLAGAVSSATMVLPGVSGSTVLVVFGYYEELLHAVNALDLVPLLLAAGGAIIGIAVTIRFVAGLIDEHPLLAMTFLTALMIGSLRALRPVSVGPAELAALAIGITAAVIWLYTGAAHQREGDL